MVFNALPSEQGSGDLTNINEYPLSNESLEAIFNRCFYFRFCWRSADISVPVYAFLSWSAHVHRIQVCRNRDESGSCKGPSQLRIQTGKEPNEWFQCWTLPYPKAQTDAGDRDIPSRLNLFYDHVENYWLLSLEVKDLFHLIYILEFSRFCDSKVST